ncbi:MAG: response regulator [Candidatus Rokuibacteriota bacterium]
MNPTRTILVIDDDQAVREMVAELLTEEGYAVVTAAAGQPGLEQARAAQPDLILMDASLPDMNGEAVVRALKADVRTRAIPVVALTGSIDPGALMAAGCLAFIPKPFDPGGFVGMIQAVLQQTAGRRPRPRAPEAGGSPDG